MENILIEGQRLRLRRANESDLKYIMNLQYAPENLKFVFPFSEDFHAQVISSDNSEKMDVIVEEVETKNAVGYFLLQDLDSPFNGIEVTHVIIGRKGQGYGREGLKLLFKWSFEVKKFHRVWLDCKTYNEVALHLYESVGMIREGVVRESLLTDGVYEDLVILAILEHEYFAQKK